MLRTGCTGPTGVRWYQFDVTGGNFPATPVQQQTWTNTNDGLWRWMPSMAVDQSGNTVLGYSTFEHYNLSFHSVHRNVLRR